MRTLAKSHRGYGAVNTKLGRDTGWALARPTPSRGEDENVG